MERNWLIRTSQNQILGPVAKEKLLEFIQKGALGMSDEVTSGNGYWFNLKEKDLVEKYLYGDVPQGYNPISEAQSVLVLRENPDRTTSINTAPANKAQAAKSHPGTGVQPSHEDLDFPDITLVKSMKSLKLENPNDSKLPASDDLEFPDVALIASTVNNSFKNGGLETTTVPASLPATDPHSIVLDFDHPPVVTATPIANKNQAMTNEDVVLPADDDLAFPDLSALDKTSTKVEKGKVDLSHQYTRTVALDTVQNAEVFPERSANDFLEEDTKKPPLTLKTETPHTAPIVNKVKTEAKTIAQEKKLKIAVKSPAAQRDPSREKYQEKMAPEPIKKRNDNYIFFILIILILIILAVFFYFKEILNKPLPV
jgi:hypothetical protein